MPHPLDGQYIIYKFGEQDSVDECWALALFRLNKGRMDEVYHPRNHVMAAHEMGEHNIEELLTLMERKKIKKVVSVHHIDDFFGIPSQWFSTESKDKPEGEEVDEWAEYASLCTDDEETQRLQAAGITVEFYDTSRNEFIK